MKTEKLSPGDFETKFKFREIENCVSCKYSTDFDYYRYCVCNHPDRDMPSTVKDCTEYICDNWE